jgi:hypothetical protein
MLMAFFPLTKDLLLEFYAKLPSLTKQLGGSKLQTLLGFERNCRHALSSCAASGTSSAEKLCTSFLRMSQILVYNGVLGLRNVDATMNKLFQQLRTLCQSCTKYVPSLPPGSHTDALREVLLAARQVLLIVYLDNRHGKMLGPVIACGAMYKTHARLQLALSVCFDRRNSSGEEEPTMNRPVTASPRALSPPVMNPKIVGGTSGAIGKSLSEEMNAPKKSPLVASESMKKRPRSASLAITSAEHHQIQFKRPRGVSGRSASMSFVPQTNQTSSCLLTTAHIGLGFVKLSSACTPTSPHQRTRTLSVGSLEETQKSMSRPLPKRNLLADSTARKTHPAVPLFAAPVPEKATYATVLMASSLTKTLSPTPRPDSPYPLSVPAVAAAAAMAVVSLSSPTEALAAA